MTDQAVITVNTTIMQGTCVRWYRDVGQAANHRPVLSASREGVAVHAQYLTSIPETWVAAAKRAHQQLARDRQADMSRWATHVNRGPSNGPLVPVQEASRG